MTATTELSRDRSAAPERDADLADLRVLAVASGGGHWRELVRLKEALAGSRVTWATVHDGYRADVPGERFATIPDATRWNKLRLLWLSLRIFGLLLRVRPHVVLSTGAAPGYLALRLGRMFGARTIWLDSFANVEELSLSGRMAGKCADLWLTQWPALARPEGPHCRGRVF